MPDMRKFWLIGIDPVKLLEWARRYYRNPWVENEWYLGRWEQVSGETETEVRAEYDRRITSYGPEERKFIEILAGPFGVDEIWKQKARVMEERGIDPKGGSFVKNAEVGK